MSHWLGSVDCQKVFENRRYLAPVYMKDYSIKLGGLVSVVISRTTRMIFPDVITYSSFTIRFKEYNNLSKQLLRKSFIKWGASSWWSFCPNSAWETMGMMNIGKTHPTLPIIPKITKHHHGLCCISVLYKYPIWTEKRFQQCKEP